MSSFTGNCESVTQEEREKLTTELTAANTLDELDKVKKPIGYPFGGTSKLYIDHLYRVMWDRLKNIHTPEDVLAAHKYFRDRNTYDRVIQEELGQIANEIFGKWHPPISGSISIN